MINLAKKEARKSKCRSAHGAAITSGGSVISKGFNTYKTHATFGGGPLKTLHAEAAAIRTAVRRGCNLKGATLYVVRNGNNQMSRPCESCQKFIEAHGIRKVVYTNEIGEIVTEWPLWSIPS